MGALVCILAIGLPALVCASNSQAKEYFREGYLASMSREWESAIALYTKSIELDPNNPETYLQRAAAFEMVDRIDEAIADYEATLALRPDYYLAMEYLAKLYESKGEYSKAVDLYSRALRVVKDAKWRSVLRWWMSQAKKKVKQAGKADERTSARSGSRRSRQR